VLLASAATRGLCNGPAFMRKRDLQLVNLAHPVRPYCHDLIAVRRRPDPTCERSTRDSPWAGFRWRRAPDARNNGPDAFG
jgi:hypothetical protein